MLAFPSCLHSTVNSKLHRPLIAGRALEDVRASLFNQFRSSEGAKRHQQRICGPAVALSFNFLVAVGIIFMNKMVCLLLFPPISGLSCVLFSNFNVSWFLFADFLGFFLFCLGASNCSIQISYTSYIDSLCSELVLHGITKSIFSPSGLSFLKINSTVYFIYSRICYVSVHGLC